MLMPLKPTTIVHTSNHLLPLCSPPQGALVLGAVLGALGAGERSKKHGSYPLGSAQSGPMMPLQAIMPVSRLYCRALLGPQADLPTCYFVEVNLCGKTRAFSLEIHADMGTPSLMPPTPSPPPPGHARTCAHTHFTTLVCFATLRTTPHLSPVGKRLRSNTSSNSSVYDNAL